LARNGEQVGARRPSGLFAREDECMRTDSNGEY
jgi:hypothetical protein